MKAEENGDSDIKLKSRIQTRGKILCFVKPKRKNVFKNRAKKIEVSISTPDEPKDDEEIRSNLVKDNEIPIIKSSLKHI